MATLKIKQISGSTETRELSRSHPLTIGRQDFNDICIPEEGVARMHCRISWNKTGFEVTAATADGIEVNSTTVAHLLLSSGDTIRVGSCDLIFDDESNEPQVLAIEEARSLRKSSGKNEPPKKAIDDLSLYEGELDSDWQEELVPFSDNKDEEFRHPKRNSKTKSKPVAGPLAIKPVRPGEQEILKSPLVLSLTGGGLTLLLITGIFWFLTSRELSNRMYDRALAEMNDGQYTQAIASFERFIQQYPNHTLRRPAERGLAKGFVQKEISGATPGWKRGLERLNELIKTHRNEADFTSLHSSLI